MAHTIRRQWPVAEFLSEAWFEALAAALAATGGTVDAAAGGTVAVGQIVTGVPGTGEVRYTVTLAPDGSGSLLRGSTAGADIVLVEDWTTAEAVASGHSTIGEMLGAGRIKLQGDTRALVGAGDLLTRVASALTPTRDGPVSGP